MSRLKVYLPSNYLKLYYNSYIVSVMDYCCTVWGNVSCTHIDKLYKLQKRAARIILNTTPLKHTISCHVQKVRVVRERPFNSCVVRKKNSERNKKP